MVLSSGSFFGANLLPLLLCSSFSFARVKEKVPPEVACPKKRGGKKVLGGEVKTCPEANINKNVLFSVYLGDGFSGSNNQWLAGYQGRREECKPETREEHYRNTASSEKSRKQCKIY
jgi:hypothetical protein